MTQEELREWLIFNASYLAWKKVEEYLEEENKKIKQDLLKIANKGEYYDMQREVLIYFSK